MDRNAEEPKTDDEGTRKPGGLGRDGTIPDAPDGVAAGHTGVPSTFEPEEDEKADRSARSAVEEDVMTDSFVPRLSPEDSNPASDLKTDVIKDVEREHTITGDFVGPRSDEIPDEESDQGEP